MVAADDALLWLLLLLPEAEAEAAGCVLWLVAVAGRG
eukprot:SAG31_NODE_1471_length_8213_cov_71.355065_4_plen_37_part_00